MGNINSSSHDVVSLSFKNHGNRERRERKCLRKECENCYVPRRWNQRFCQEPDCQRLVRRWQAAKRQRRQRETEAGRKNHRERERGRRELKRQQPPNAVATKPHAPANCAWSRSKQIPENFCDRPGCYEETRYSPKVASKYCGDTCREAVARVRDRERKWLMRQASTKTSIPASSYQRQQSSSAAACGSNVLTGGSRNAIPVFDYRKRRRLRLSSRAHERAHERSEVDDHERDSCTRPRPPPTAQ